MAEPKKPSVLEPLRVRVRRFQLVVGMGFAALVAGAIVSAPLGMRLQPRLQSLGSETVGFLVGGLLSWLWLWAMLPAFCYGAARVLELRPWSTAIGAALTGEVFLGAISVVSSGLEGLARPIPELVMQAVMFAVGVVLSRTAVVKARVAKARTQKASLEAAEEKKSRYSEFAAEAERLAARREANPIAPPAPLEPASTRSAVPADASEASPEPGTASPVIEDGSAPKPR